MPSSMAHSLTVKDDAVCELSAFTQSESNERDRARV